MQNGAGHSLTDGDANSQRLCSGGFHEYTFPAIMLEKITNLQEETQLKSLLGNEADAFYLACASG
jgi:hypothetical protein